MFQNINELSCCIGAYSPRIFNSLWLSCDHFWTESLERVREKDENSCSTHMKQMKSRIYSFVGNECSVVNSFTIHPWFALASVSADLPVQLRTHRLWNRISGGHADLRAANGCVTCPLITKTIKVQRLSERDDVRDERFTACSYIMHCARCGLLGTKIKKIWHGNIQFYCFCFLSSTAEHWSLIGSLPYFIM